MSAPGSRSEMLAGIATAAAAPAGNKVRFAIVNGVLVEQIFTPVSLKESTMIHQTPLRIVKSRNWVQIGCTRMDWTTYDELVRQVGEDQ